MTMTAFTTQMLDFLGGRLYCDIPYNFYFGTSPSLDANNYFSFNILLQCLTTETVIVSSMDFGLFVLEPDMFEIAKATEEYYDSLC